MWREIPFEQLIFGIKIASVNGEFWVPISMSIL